MGHRVVAAGDNNGSEGRDWEQYRLQVRRFLLRRFEEMKAKASHRGKFYHRGQWVSVEMLREAVRRHSRQSLHSLLEILLLFVALLSLILTFYKSYARYLR